MLTDQRRICVSICERDLSALGTAFKRASEAGDLVEVRLDCFNEQNLSPVVSELQFLLNSSQIPTIITLRPEEQGGMRPIALSQRAQFWTEHGFRLPAAFFDLEIDLCEHLLEQKTDVDWSRVICSFHDFGTGVDNLIDLYHRLARIPAGVLKIAVALDDANEIADIFALLRHAKTEHRTLIAVGMGAPGVATRILGPSSGSFLTYATLAIADATAPAQPTVRDLLDLYRFDHIDEATQVMGLVGHPTGHSLSPRVHNAAFEARSVNAVYLPFEVRDLHAFIRRVVHPGTRELSWNLAGLSVTTPHKLAVMDHLDWIEPDAVEIGAVNTILISQDKLHGYNTDAIGFLKSLGNRAGNLKDAACAVIGTGGVANTAIWAFLKAGAKVTVFARNPARANNVKARFRVNVLPLNDAAFCGFDVVVNATVLGMSDEHESKTAASAEQLAGARLAYDLVYNPIDTRFLQEARKAGCDALGGLPMFVAQAAEQFRLWTRSEAPVEVMQAAAMQGLTEAT